jgi:hypothetical protein
MNDPQKYRVNLICACDADIAYGYGATIKEARANAIKFFRRDHRRGAKWRAEIIEHAVEHNGGSHYEEIPS